MREYGRRVEPSTRFATAMVGSAMWELIEPLDDQSIWGRFLAEKGEGVHHIAVVTPSYDDALAAEAKRGNPLALSGTFSGIKVSYLPTDRTLGGAPGGLQRLAEAEKEDEHTKETKNVSAVGSPSDRRVSPASPERTLGLGSHTIRSRVSLIRWQVTGQPDAVYGQVEKAPVSVTVVNTWSCGLS